MRPIIPLDELLALPDRGARGLRVILRLAQRGDWLTRSLALSAAGRIAGSESPVRRASRWLLRRVPGWRTRFPSAAYARDFIANGLVDRSWAVRTAAALALGECVRRKNAAALQSALGGPYRAERIAAAAALMRCGEPPSDARAILDSAMPVPAGIGDSSDSIEFLTLLAARHAGVLEEWRRVPGAAGPGDSSASAWGRFLAGQVTQPVYEGPQAEQDRYDAGEAAYLLAKPFSSINRVHNVRLLHTFLALAEHLRAPIGARVLDLGSGSGWVSELLAKLGYQPYTLDISSVLLGIGRERFARQSLPARFMCGDMTRLPVASGSMDAVMVTDALHHVPDVPAVFREAFRVLADGGQFLLAEPGEGHSETAKSRGEMAQYGVQEREIHVGEAVEYGRHAGFGDIRVVPASPPLLHMTPADLADLAEQSADDWLFKNDRGERISFAPYVLQSLFDHPVLVFQKGRRVIDSRVPGVLRAVITPHLQRRGRRVSGRVAVRNAGDTTWLAGRTEAGAVLLGVHVLARNRKLVQLDCCRAPLDKPLAPGEATDLSLDFDLPEETTPYCLKLDLVAEGVCWFEDAGCEPLCVDV